MRPRNHDAVTGLVFLHECGTLTTMAYLVRVTEWETGGREFLIFYKELPAILAESISRAEPTSLRMLVSDSCRILDSRLPIPTAAKDL